MTRNGRAYKRRTLAPRISGTASSSSPTWPTPSVSGFSNEGQGMKVAASAASYEEAVAMTDGRKSVVDRHWPTPTAAAASQGANDPDGRRGQTLVGAANGQPWGYWPTPTAKANQTAPSMAKSPACRPLAAQASSATTPGPSWTPFESEADANGGDATRRTALNPEWTSWLMGFPPGWLDV